MSKVGTPSTVSERSTQYSNSPSSSIKSNVSKNISTMLSKIIEAKKAKKSRYRKTLKEQQKSIFSLEEEPEIKLEEYIERLKTLMELEESTVILSLMYIDRFTSNSNIVLTHLNIHNLIFTAILVAVKYNQDNVYSFDYYSEVSGIPCKEIVELEYLFLTGIDFRLYYEKNEYDTYEMNIIQSNEKEV